MLHIAPPKFAQIDAPPARSVGLLVTPLDVILLPNLSQMLAIHKT